MTTTDGTASGLDQLISEVEAEAARRRAAPGYPHDLEARIEAELARQAPAPNGRVSLDRLVTEVEEASFISIDVPVTASRREYTYAKTVLKRGMAWYLRHVADQVSSLGYATARTLRAITVRIEDIEDRVAAVERSRESEPAESLPEAGGTESYLREWLDDVAEQLVGVHGRVLCADVEVEEVVARLRGDGLDAYGLTRDASPYLLSPDVRQGDLIAHLGSVGDGALGAAILAGCTNAMNGPSLRAVIEELGRCIGPEGVVAAVSEAPWWWHHNVHPVEADTAEARPLQAETWLAGLHEAGFEATAAYDPAGHSYALVARPEGGPRAFMTGRVIQVVPTFTPRDAIGDHARQVDRLLREAGYDTQIYASTAHGDLGAISKPFRDLTDRGNSGAVLLIHHSTGTVAADRLRDRPEPLIMDYHNITPPEMWANWEAAVAAELGWGRRQLRDLAGRTHAALADSRFNADELVDLGYAHVEVAPIVRDLGPADRRPRSFDPKPDPEFLFVGRVSPNKCQHDLIAALALYRKLYQPAARLRLIGGVSSPSYRSALTRMANDLGVAEAVTIDDNGVPDDQLLAAYERAAVFVCMSRHEGFCVPLVEAMRHALPIVALGGSAVTETVAGGGLLLRGNDPLVVATAWHRVAADPAVATALSAAAVDRGAAFDLHLTAKAFLDAFKRAVDGL